MRSMDEILKDLYRAGASIVDEEKFRQFGVEEDALEKINLAADRYLDATIRMSDIAMIAFVLANCIENIRQEMIADEGLLVIPDKMKEVIIVQVAFAGYTLKRMRDVREPMAEEHTHSLQ